MAAAIYVGYTLAGARVRQAREPQLGADKDRELYTARLLCRGVNSPAAGRP